MKTTHGSKSGSNTYSQRLALESRLVFDGAIVPTAVDTTSDVLDAKAVADPIVVAVTPTSDPTLAVGLEKTPVIVDYQPTVDSPVPAFTTQDSIAIAMSPIIIDSSGDATASTLIVVDPRISNAADLLAHPPANTQVISLDLSRDGFLQVADILQTRHNITELDVMAWTDSNNKQWLGSQSLSSTLEPSVTAALTQWGDSFANNANIIFHSANNLGASQLSYIDALTGANASWSSDTDFNPKQTALAHEIIVVDTGIANYQSLLNGVNPTAEILYIDHSKDGVSQIADALKGRSDIASLQILSHGSDGTLILGSTVLNSTTLELYKTQLADIGRALTDNGDILLYGCDVANSATGIAFINQLASLTNADVAASIDATGNAIKGGDWVLEYNTGNIETVALADSHYQDLLAAPTIADATPIRTLAEDGTLSITGITIADVDGNNQTVTLSSANGIITLATGSGVTGVTGDGTGAVSFTGTLAQVNAAINGMTFAPTANFNGTATLTLSTNDGTTTITLSPTISVTAVNDTPVAVVDTNSIVEKSVSVIGNVLTNDTDVDIGDTKTVSALTSGTVGIPLVGNYGSLLLNTDGSYTYTLDNTNPAVQALGSASVPLSDSFTYTMKDTAGATSTATLNVSITGLNDQPVLTIAPVALTQVEDTSTVFTVGSLLTNASNAPIWTDTDVGTAMGVAITAAPTTDAASLMTGTWKYSLDGGGSWIAFPAVSVTNALLLPSTAQVQFFATHDASIDSKNSGSVSLTYTAWDASSGIAGGTANTTAPTSTSPFSSVSNTAILNVTPVNDTPIFSSTGLTVNEHSSSALSGSFTDNAALIAGLTGNLKIYDPDNTTAQILYRIEELPTNGTLTLNGAVLSVGSLFSQANVASIIYTPTVGELAADTTDGFYFSIRDGAGGVIGADGKTGANPWAFLGITIKDVNAQVAVTGTSLAIAENNLAPNVPVIAPVALSMSDADDPTGLRTLTLTSLPTATFGKLQYWNGSIYEDVTPAMVNVLTFTQAQLTDPIHPALQFVYNNATEPTDGNGVPIPAQSQTSFTVHVNDNNTHLPVTTADSTVTINITPSNDPPVLVTSGLTVVQNSTANIINITNIITTDPDSAVSARTYTVDIDPTLGYLTLNGVRIGRGATFTEADLTSGRLQYNSNPYTYGNDSLKVVVTDGNGGSSAIQTLGITISFVNPNTLAVILNPTFGTNAAGNPTIFDPNTNQTFDLAVPPIGSGTPVGGNTASITGTFKGISPEGLFLKLDNTMLKDVGTGPATTLFTVTQPAHGKVYLNGIELVYGTTTFTQADINSGGVVYVHDSSEANAYAFTDTLNITANKGGSTITQAFTITVTPVDDAPTISQTVFSYNLNEAGGLLMEQNSDGSNGLATANFLLSNVTNAKKLTTANFQWNDIDNTQSQLTYMASAVNGTIATWNGTAWVAIAGSFTADQLAAGQVAYFHDPSKDVTAPDNILMDGSVTVYLIDGATVAAGNVQILPPSITELGTLSVTDGTNTISLAKNAQMISPSRTVTFQITDINDPPVANNTSFTVTEFSSGIVGQTNHIQILNTSIVSASDSDTGNGTWTYTLTALPTDGRIEISSDNFATTTTMVAGDTFTYAQLAAGNLRYVNTGRLEVTLGLNWNAAQDSFKFKLNDGELISNPKPLDSNEATVSIFLRPTNQPPVVVHTGPASIPEGGTLNIISTLLGSENPPNNADVVAVVDVDNNRVQVQYRITANVGHGILYLGNPATGAVVKQLSVGSAFTLEDIQLGKVWYQHNGTESAPYGNQDFFDYVISDASGMNEPAAQFVINLDATKSVNDAPVVTGLAGGATFTEGGTGALPNVSPILIDSSVVLTDPDLANNNLDFRGGSLELAYATGGSNVTSLFDQLAIKNIGGVGIGISGTNITYGGVTIASIDATKNGQNGAALKIIFDTNANTSLTIPAVQALIAAITFEHTEYDNAVTGLRTLNYTLIDGGGTASYTLNGITVTGHDTWTGSAIVTVAPANDRPIITLHTGVGNLPLGTITEDDTTTPLTFQVSSFTTATNATLPDGTHTGIVDVDTGAVRGIAITGLTNAATGHWEYSTNGTSWTAITGASATNALLLLATDYIRFVPDGSNGGVATVTYKAWDTTSGSAHTYVNPNTNNTQTSAFSIATDTAEITVSSVNDAPVLASTALNMVNEYEDFAAPVGAVGTLVSSLVGGVSDVDTGAVKGLAITAADASNGSWYFTTDGGTNWNPLGTPSATNAVLLASDANTRLYFQPNANYNGIQATALTVRAWDQTSGTNGSLNVDTSSNGGSTAFSAATNTVSLNVIALNDAPTILNSTPIISAAGLANENTPLVLGSIFTLGEIDLARFEGTNKGQITLSVPHGGFVIDTTGITVTAGTQATDRNGLGDWGGGTTTLSFTGTLAQLQTALNTVKYVAGDNPDNSETITVTLDDLTNFGLGSVNGGSDVHTASTTVVINGINLVNDAPTVTRPANVTAVEDTQFSFTGGNLISITDVDARNGIVEVALSIPKGVISLTLSGATSVFSGSLGSGAFTLHGTITDINASLATLKYTAALDDNSLNTTAADRTLTINVSDLGNSLGGVATTAQTATATTVITVNAVNDAPTIDVDSTVGIQTTRIAVTSVSESTTTAITDIVVADNKDINNTGYGANTNVVITALHGILSLTASAGVTAVASGAGRIITLTGTIADINAAIAAGNFKCTPDTNFSGNDTLSLVFHDAGNSGTGGDLTAAGSITLLVSGLNDTPVFSALGGGTVLSPDVTFAENGAAIVLDANATVSDPELSVYNNWGGSVLTLQRTATTGNTGVLADDVYSLTGSGNVGVNFNAADIRIGTTIVGTFTNTGGVLAITFANTTTTAQVNQVLQAIKYSNSNDNPPTSVTVGYTLNDGNTNTGVNAQGGANPTLSLTGSGQVIIGISATNDAPTLTGIVNTTYTEDAAAIQLAPVAIPADPELSFFASQTGDWGNASLVLSRNGGAQAEDVFSALGSSTVGLYLDTGNTLKLDGNVIGTYSNAAGSLTLSFANGVTTANVQAALRGIGYNNTDQTLGVGIPKTITLNWVLHDGDTDPDRVGNGQGTGGDKTVTVAQVITMTGVNDTPTTVGSLPPVTRVDATLITPIPTKTAFADIDSNNVFSFTATGLPTGLTIDPATGIITGTLTANASQGGTGGVYTITVTAKDSTGATINQNFDFTATNPAPTAHADTGTITENTATLSVSAANGVILSGLVSAGVDTDPDNDPLAVIGVKAGTAVSVIDVGIANVSTALAGSYGSLTLNPDGSYTYALDNANPAVNKLRTGQSLTDTFSYTVSDNQGGQSFTTLTITINGITDGAPTITPVDTNGALTGEATVFEKGLVAPTDSSQTTEGTINVTSPDGMASITIGGTTFTVAQLAGFSFASPSAAINTGVGTLKVTWFSIATGASSAPTSGTLSYIYTLNAALTHTGATALESVDSIPLVVTDATTAASTTNGTLTIRIVDDTPTANADTNNVIEDVTSAGITSGNVFGATGAAGSDVADRIGADTTATPVTAVSFGATTGTVGSALTSTYGKLLLKTDGSYTYTLDNTNPVVNALRNGQTLTEIFNYTITDADGDSSSTTLTITIYGTTDGTPTITPVDTNGALTGEATVFEKGLVAPTDNSQTTTGTITVTSPDGMASVTVGGTTFTVAQLATFTSASPSVAINTGVGTLKVTGFSIATGASSAPTSGTLSYSYTLNAAQSNTVNPLESVDSIALAVTDATTAAINGIGTLTIRIVDDTPTANADKNSVTEGITTADTIISGNVFGATGAAATDVADRIGADTTATPVTAVSFGATTGVVGSALTSTYGSLILNANGSYTYTLDNTNPVVNALRNGQTLTEIFNYTITDADGDPSSTTLTITINGTTDGTPTITPVDTNGALTGEATVFEKGLVAPTDNSQTTTGTITVTSPDGVASVTVGGTTFTVAQLATFTTASPSIAINTGVGTLKVTGFSITTGASSAPTSGTLSYSYTLNAAQPHTGATALESVDSFALVVTDATTAASTANGTLTIRIVDDTPTANADINSVTEGITTAATLTSGNVFGATGAAATDVVDRIGADATATPVTAVSFGATTGVVGSALTSTYGKLLLKADGSYTYTLDNTNTTVNKLVTGQTLTEVFNYTITDTDGDISSTTLTITINGTTDGAPTITPVDTNGALTGEASVFEKGLITPTDNSQITTGTITVTSPDGMASVTIGGTSFTVTQLAVFTVGSPSAAINTGKGTIVVTGFAIDTGATSAPTQATLSYQYTLTATQNPIGGSAITESTDAIALIVTDATTAASTANGTLTIRIVDDVPNANADTNSVTEGITTADTIISGNVFATTGAAASDVADRIGADTTATPVTAVSFGATAGTVGSALTSTYGSLILNANGSYTYTLDNTNPVVNALRNGQTLTEVFNYTITDADGDTSSTTLTITINGTTDDIPIISPVDGNGTATGQATVFEKGLVAPTDNSQTTTGTIIVTAPDGMASVTIEGKKFTVADLATFSTLSPSAAINTGEGTLKITGFSIVSGAIVAPTAGILSYQYTLNASQNQAGGVLATESTDQIALAVTDVTTVATTSTGTLTIGIIDDVPTANADSNTVIEGITAAASTTSGNVFGKTGASVNDVADRIGADTTATPISAISFGANKGTVGQILISNYGSLILNADGSYTYTIDNTNPVVDALHTGQTLSEVFNYTITDADGDRRSSTLTITINGRNDPPTAVNDSVKGVSGQAVVIDVIANDTDPEHDLIPSTVKILGTAKAGDSLVVAGQGIWSVNPVTGAITFTPESGFTADPTPIKYSVQDKTGLVSNFATVSIDYPQTPPVAVNDTAAGLTGQASRVDVLANDADPENDIDPSTVQIVGTANAGDSLFVSNQGFWSVDAVTGAITFTPVTGFQGDPSPIKYTVQDKTGLVSQPATVSVHYPDVTNDSGSLILLSNPDKSYNSDWGNLEEKKWLPVRKLYDDFALPPVHLSLYVPLRNHVISLTGSLRDQLVLELERYSFSLPRWTFRHTDPNEQLEFEATRPDGSGLPAWLLFNPKTLKFSGVPPKGVHDERVMVTVRDTYGNEVHPTFSVHVNKERLRPEHKVFEPTRLTGKPVGKSALSDQVQAAGKLTKLRESRALLDSLRQLQP
jgi:VCBS repeat-containing protein/CshA-type fibril repeat protein